MVFFSEYLGFFRFVSFYFKTVCFGCFASISKQRVSMFRLNQNKEKTNRNSLIESIFWYFSENLGLFGFILKQFCLFWLFRFETPKQTEFLCFWFHKTNRKKNTTKTDLVSVYFGSTRKTFLFVLRTPNFTVCPFMIYSEVLPCCFCFFRGCLGCSLQHEIKGVLRRELRAVEALV